MHILGADRSSVLEPERKLAVGGSQTYEETVLLAALWPIR